MFCFMCDPEPELDNTTLLHLNPFNQDGFETIDAAFKTFVNQTTLDDFQYYVVELQTTANKYFKAEKVREYLTILKASDGGVEACHVITHYILVILGKILML